MKSMKWTLAAGVLALGLVAGCKETTTTETTPTSTEQTATTTSVTGNVTTETTSTEVSTDTSTTAASTDTSRAALKQDASKIGSDLKDAAHHAAVATGTALEKAGQKLQKEGEKH